MRDRRDEKNKRLRICAAFAATLLAAACMPGALWLHDDLIDGPYRLRAAADIAEMHICYDRRNGNCDLRIPGRVFAIAYDENFIAAAVRPMSIGTEKDFYYIVREFDAPGADADRLKRIVRGPYSHDEFLAEMRDHCVPAPRIRVPATGLLAPSASRERSCSSSSHRPKT